MKTFFIIFLALQGLDMLATLAVLAFGNYPIQRTVLRWQHVLGLVIRAGWIGWGVLLLGKC